jgi:hypothetical protein
MKKRIKKEVFETVEVQSSRIKEFRFYPRSKRLLTVFHKGGEYFYKGVTREEFDQIIKSDSIGKSFQSVILDSGKEVIKMS